jgi:hypothetical protein
MFVITFQITDVPGQLKYLNIDYSSGGYPYWDNHLSGAKFFTSMENVQKMLDSDEFKRNNTYSSYMSAPSMIYGGLGLCDVRESGTGVIGIKSISLNDVSNVTVSAMRDKPMLFGKKIDTEYAKKLIKFDRSLTVYSDSEKYFFADEATTELHEQNPGFMAIKYFFPFASADKVIDNLEGLIEVQYSKETYCGE